MDITNNIIEKHGLKKNEYEEVNKLLKRNQIYLNLVFFSNVE